MNYVEKGVLEIEDLIPLDKLKSMDKKIAQLGSYEGLTELRQKLKNEFEFNELRLYLSWKKVEKE
jgi:hypothetical protein